MTIYIIFSTFIIAALISGGFGLYYAQEISTKKPTISQNLKQFSDEIQKEFDQLAKLNQAHEYFKSLGIDDLHSHQILKEFKSEIGYRDSKLNSLVGEELRKKNLGGE